MVAVVAATRQRANKAAAVPAGEAVADCASGECPTRGITWVGALGRLWPSSPSASIAALAARFAHSSAPLPDYVSDVVRLRPPTYILPQYRRRHDVMLISAIEAEFAAAFRSSAEGAAKASS
jgi:hypothetical protein